MKYYLGIDIGTTSTKAVAFSENGAVIKSFSFDYDMLHPQPDMSEQDPEKILSAVVSGINKMAEAMAPNMPLFVSFSAAMHSLIAVDKNCKALTACIIWADNRADDIAEALKKTNHGQQIYQATGVPIHAMSPLCKLLWFKAHQPDLYKAAHKFIGIKEYIFYKLFGEFVVDSSIASATGLLNLASLQWDADILTFLEITPSRLSRVVSPKEVFYYKNNYPGLALSPQIPVVISASDGALANLGTGATGSHAMAVTIGTSGAARMVVNSAETDEAMRTFCYHIKDNDYICGGGNNNGALVLQWLKEELLQTNDTFDELFAQAATVAAGSDGLLLLPYILGERAPLWNSSARGVLFGLAIQHTKAHLVRAALEGVIFGLYSIIKILAEKKQVTALHASGGFAKSQLWLQILADVSNIKVLISDSVESSALGAVMLGAEAVGVETEIKDNFSQTYEPDATNHAVYKKQFAKFERIYDLLKSEMVNTSTAE